LPPEQAAIFRTVINAMDAFTPWRESQVALLPSEGFAMDEYFGNRMRSYS
jgi:hypothetical protein